MCDTQPPTRGRIGKQVSLNNKLALGSWTASQNVKYKITNREQRQGQITTDVAQNTDFMNFALKPHVVKCSSWGHH